MLVKIEEIQEKGLTLNAPVEPKVLEAALLDGGDFTLRRSTPLAASFVKVSGQVHLKGSLTVDVAAPCRRCLTEVHQTISVQFALRMVQERPKEDDEDEAEPAKKGRAGRKERREEPEEASFELDEVDAEPFDGKTIDLDPIVREQVLLALPVSVLCKEECKGLCATCGQDLNVSDCGHGATKPPDPRLAKLKDIKLKN